MSSGFGGGGGGGVAAGGGVVAGTGALSAGAFEAPFSQAVTDRLAPIDSSQAPVTTTPRILFAVMAPFNTDRGSGKATAGVAGGATSAAVAVRASCAGGGLGLLDRVRRRRSTSRLAISTSWR